MRTWLKWMSFIAAAALLVALFRTDSLSALLTADPDVLREQSKGSTFMLLLITLLLMVVQNLFTVIPLFLLVTVNITLFDFPGGYLWSWFTSIIGALAAFYATRYWVYSLLAKLVNDRMKMAMEENGFWVVLAGRLLPLPSSVVNIAGGMSTVGWRSYLYATILQGILPDCYDKEAREVIVILHGPVVCNVRITSGWISERSRFFC